MTFEKSKIDSMIERNGKSASACIPILQDIQEEYKFLPLDALKYVCEKTGIPETQLYGVATFYAQFRFSPIGKHLIKVCHGTACHVAGAVGITESIENKLNVKDGATTDDKKFTLESVACLGCCSLAPVVMVDDTTYGKLSRVSAPRAVIGHAEKIGQPKPDLLKGVQFEPAIIGDKAIKQVVIGLGSCGIASGAFEVKAFFEQAVERFNLDTRVGITGCMGMCHNEPLVELTDSMGRQYLYKNIDFNRAKQLLTEHIGKGLVLEKNLIQTNASDIESSAFFEKQKRIVLENCGIINPESIDEYIAKNGYTALKKAFDIKQDAVIGEIKTSGLRGRGGAGFPTALKWQFVQKAQADQKYIICNADEGDPGAFMDRSVLESDPHRVLEGMIIASYAMGATEGYIYCRAEYPLALKRLDIAITQAREKGFIGKNILGSGHSFDVHVKEGAGAFVCGEETALIASIEGKRGMPRLRPPFPANSGLFGKPTNINNVETYANVPWIINHGGEKFAAMGTEKSKGSKVFALAGKIKRGGLVEVPMGITLREIINDIGGGTSSGKPVKAVQLGGPSGGCIPESLMDTKVDYDEVNQTGAIMGSGGMVVIDSDACMVDIARFFLDFTEKESCGKCTFCRVGTKRMLEILNRITDGNGKDGDIELLEELADKIKNASLCGLGQTAPNPVLTTIKYFRNEYEAHIKDKKCPALHCKAMILFRILEEKCTGCTACVRACPVNAISGEKKKLHVIDQPACTQCGACLETCKFDAIIKE